MSHVSAFICIVAAIAAASATDYCSRSTCNPGVTHIACHNRGSFASTCPHDAALVTIDANLKSTLVKAHNDKRNLIAGGGVANHRPACRMATMQWDDELASLAALNVKQCAMTHDGCHNTNAFRFAGQNLASMGYHGKPNDASMLSKAVNIWYKEVSFTRPEYIKAFPNNYSGPDIGHFTVMVADRNIRLGCAAATYSAHGGSKSCLVACNYATTNMINFPIYASCNKAGSSCKTGRNPTYPNLCAKSEVYNVNKWF